jgi:hypothetical protein
MTLSALASNKLGNGKADTLLGERDKVSLKSQYKALSSGTEDKFEAWLMTIEDQWTAEIAACLQGKFPDWRG